MQPLELSRGPPGQLGLAVGDSDEQQREPGQQDAGADAVLAAVEDGPQLGRGLEVAEAAFGLEQVLVAERDVLGREVRVRGGKQELPVERRSRREADGAVLRATFGSSTVERADFEGTTITLPEAVGSALVFVERLRHALVG